MFQIILSSNNSIAEVIALISIFIVISGAIVLYKLRSDPDLRCSKSGTSCSKTWNFMSLTSSLVGCCRLLIKWWGIENETMFSP